MVFKLSKWARLCILRTKLGLYNQYNFLFFCRYVGMKADGTLEQNVFSMTEALVLWLVLWDCG